MLRVSPGGRPTRRLIAIAVPGVITLLVACSGAPAPKATPVASTSAPVSTAAPATTTPAATAAAAKASGTPSASATPPATTTPAATPAAPAAATTAAPASTPVAPKATPPAAPAAPSVTTVASSIANFAFAPVSGSAPLVVTWTNNDTVEHDVIFADGSSPVLAPGATFQRRFETPGTFAFSCSFHPFMTGNVTVR